MNDEESTRKIGTYVVRDRIVDGPLWVAHTASRPGASETATIWMLRPDLELVTSRTNQLVKQLSRLTGLNRPGLLNVTAIGTTAAGPYVVTGDARGETLDHYLTRFPEGLDPSEAVRIVLSVAAVLDEAHRRALVAHGALDPSKILLFERTPRVVVRELGLLEAVRLSGIVASERIAASIARCRAPEIDRSVDRIEPATDQYALASIAFELLTGQSAWKAESGADAAPKLVASYRSDVPAEVDFVLLRARSHSPAERYASITDFAVAFRRAVLANGPTAASHASLWPKGASQAPPPIARRSSRPPASTRPERILLDSRVDDEHAVASRRTQPPASRKSTPPQWPAQPGRPQSSRPPVSASTAITLDERATKAFVPDDAASDDTWGASDTPARSAAPIVAAVTPVAEPPAKPSEPPAQADATDAKAPPAGTAIEAETPAPATNVSATPVAAAPLADPPVASPTNVSDQPAVADAAASPSPHARTLMPYALTAAGVSAAIVTLFLAMRTTTPAHPEPSATSASTAEPTDRPTTANPTPAVVPVPSAVDPGPAANPAVANGADTAVPPVVAAPERPPMRLWEPTVEERAAAQQHIEVGINICGLQFGQHGRHARAAVTYDGTTGTVENVLLTGTYFQHVRIGSCIADAVRAVHVPPFNRRHWTTTYVLAVP